MSLELDEWQCRTDREDEGFGDYWAATVTQTVAPGSDPACIGDWDATSYTVTVPHCLRRIDTNLRHPDDLNGSVHHDGQIWSAALWDIRSEVEARTAATFILDAQFDFAPDMTMPAAASTTAVAARARCTALQWLGTSEPFSRSTVCSDRLAGTTRPQKPSNGHCPI